MEHDVHDQHGPTEHEQDQHSQIVSEQDRMDFLRRIMTMFAVAVVLVTVAVLVLVLAFVNTNVTRSIRQELREHEKNEAVNRVRIQNFVAEQHDVTRNEVARFRKRIAQLEDELKRRGLPIPRNGFVSGLALPDPNAPPPPDPSEGLKPGPGGRPDPLPPHPTPVVPGPPDLDPGPPIQPPVPTPIPTGTCIDLPDPAPDFCV